MPLEEALHGVPEGKYPIAETLINSGVAGLFEYVKPLGFTPDSAGYTSGCALCFHIRRWLCAHAPHAELDAEHYEASLAYY